MLLPKKEELMGKMVEVKIVAAGKHFLKGELLEKSQILSPNNVLPLPQGKVSGVTVSSH